MWSISPTQHKRKSCVSGLSGCCHVKHVSAMEGESKFIFVKRKERRFIFRLPKISVSERWNGDPSGGKYNPDDRETWSSVLFPFSNSESFMNCLRIMNSCLKQIRKKLAPTFIGAFNYWSKLIPRGGKLQVDMGIRWVDKRILLICSN